MGLCVNTRTDVGKVALAGHPLNVLLHFITPCIYSGYTDRAPKHETRLELDLRDTLRRILVRDPAPIPRNRVYASSGLSECRTECDIKVGLTKGARIRSLNACRPGDDDANDETPTDKKSDDEPEFSRFPSEEQNPERGHCNNLDNVTRSVVACGEDDVVFVRTKDLNQVLVQKVDTCSTECTYQHAVPTSDTCLKTPCTVQKDSYDTAFCWTQRMFMMEPIASDVSLVWNIWYRLGRHSSTHLELAHKIARRESRQRQDCERKGSVTLMCEYSRQTSSKVTLCVR